MSYKHLRHSILTFACAVLQLALTVPKHSPVSSLRSWLHSLPSRLIYNATAAVHVPENRQRHSPRVLVWVLVPLIAGLFSVVLVLATTRSTANAMVSAVTEYRSRTGTWPTPHFWTLESMFRSAAFESRIGYKLRDGEPSLTYLATGTDLLITQ